MKKIFLLLFTFFSFSYFFGQGNNLQFSQVIFNEYSTTIGPTTGYQSAGTLTVGANKTIKITSASTGCSGNKGGVLKIGDHYIFASNESNLPKTPFPIWLPTGSYIITLYYANSNYGAGAATCNATISGVEFNIVQ